MATGERRSKQDDGSHDASWRPNVTRAWTAPADGGPDEAFVVDHSVPGFPEISAWPPAAVPPFQAVAADIWRDGGTRCADIADARGVVYLFWFDRELHRPGGLADHPDVPGAAWVRAMSPLALDLWDALQSAAERDPGTYGALVRDCERWLDPAIAGAPRPGRSEA